jgi:hypothetical protein
MVAVILFCLDGLHIGGKNNIKSDLEFNNQIKENK